MIAIYPSPAGATESLFSLHGWKVLCANNPELAELNWDVEAVTESILQKEAA